uniref:Uncharacterized protein n=1 Tax=Chromera velia CCMP2878 TaxID=1169474 RepID=A0A0G4HK73_9ALVE|eukprot:Cvel_7176.t1-p1 / transcript=Cvel_7176.t1 / gene=Cvel_7176 / organism=Chromera_velia_CCMP2878 / gene_product=hypothetical protein / transcript_product=hypothetical protein / location=Cvel_scaffold369:45957-46397(-) / protein_length=147 / sequence_SO=supercontig / SO=protein_coding / is_pseudo=false
MEGHVPGGCKESPLPRLLLTAQTVGDIAEHAYSYGEWVGWGPYDFDGGEGQQGDPGRWPRYLSSLVGDEEDAEAVRFENPEESSEGRMRSGLVPFPSPSLIVRPPSRKEDDEIWWPYRQVKRREGTLVQSISGATQARMLCTCTEMQ